MSFKIRKHNLKAYLIYLQLSCDQVYLLDETLLILVFNFWNVFVLNKSFIG